MRDYEIIVDENKRLRSELDDLKIRNQQLSDKLTFSRRRATELELSCSYHKNIADKHLNYIENQQETINSMIENEKVLKDALQGYANIDGVAGEIARNALKSLK